MSDFEPKQFGKYFLIEKIAVGGMAEIYKAKTFGVDGFEKELAIKRILPHCSADKDFISMLVDEAKLAVMLSHANIVQVYDLGKVGDDYFISMEFIHGVNLRDLTYRGREAKTPMDADVAVYIASEICKGLDYAHRKTDQRNQPLGIVHRDVSPQNILISYEGEVKIVDFGIAKAAMNISHTMAGILKGKIAYMSPEQACGKAIDKRTDIFSAGILLYEMITGTKLYTGESQFEVLKKIRTTRITAETLPESIPEALKSVVAKVLAYNPDERYQNAGDLQIDLTKFLYSTFADFSPRKLAGFIHQVFSGDMTDDEMKKARAAAFEHQTASMSLGEGAKQLDIVHREASIATGGATIAAQTSAQKLVETIKIPHEKGARIRKDANAEPPTESAGPSKKKKLGKIPLMAGAGILAIMAIYLAFRFIPALRISEKPSFPSSAGKAEMGIIRVFSEPAGAKIILDGKDTGKITPSVLDDLIIGKSYAIRVEKEGMAPSGKSVDLSSAEPVDVTLAISAETGTLNLVTDPPGANVLVDGSLTGLSTPATLEKLPLGSDLKLTLSKPEYEDFEQIINLTSSKPQKISTKLKIIAPQTGKLVMTSMPPGAAIVINGTNTGRTTPATIANLDPGRYTVTFSINGYEKWTGNYDVGAGSSVPADATLKRSETAVIPAPEIKPVTEAPPPEKQKASLKVTSSPNGARITLDGRNTGIKTPATLGDLKLGSTYSIGFSLDGYKALTKRKSMKTKSETLYAQLAKEEERPPPVEIAQPAQPAPVQKTPPPEPPKEEPAEAAGSSKPGSVKVASNPPGADVFINSEHKGKTPLTVSVQPGSVSVLVNKEGFAKYSRQITVKPGQTVNLTDIALGDMYGEVSLTSDPPRAAVVFDGQSIPAPTPVTVRKVRKGESHTVTIQLSGYRSWSKTFTMDSNTKAFNVTLQPQ